ncbi:MAG: MATE family efflux transporter [Chloroflexi bacterium]|nr:MATE family efflux transporter [Chloroflexota bacterium]
MAPRDIRQELPDRGIPDDHLPTKPAETGQRASGQRSIDRKLTEGSIPRNLFYLAWPQMLTGVLQATQQMADLVWAGFLGPRAIASIGVAQSWTMLFMTARMGLDTAARAMVSRAVGAGDMKLANHIATQAIMLSATISFVLTFLGFIFTESLLHALGVSDEVVAQGAAYMRFQFVASFVMAMQFSSAAVLQASGDAVTPMKSQMIARTFQIVVSPLLVFGLLGLPAEGLVGASIATAIGQGIGSSMNFYALFTGKSRLTLSFRNYRLDVPLLWRQLQLGAPSSTTQMASALSNVVVVGLVTSFGDFTLAAYAITQRLQQLVFLGSQGLGQASGILVGQNLGANHPERAKATVWWALGYVMIMNTLVGGLMFLFPALFLTIFTRDPTVLEVGIPWLHIQVIGFMGLGAGMVFQQTFNTAGDTFVPMFVILATVWGVQQPLAIMLSGIAQNWSLFGVEIPVPAISHMGEFGIAWAIAISVGVRLAIYFPYFIWGPWMRKRVY